MRFPWFATQLATALAAHQGLPRNLVGYSPSLERPLTAEDTVPNIQYLSEPSPSVVYGYLGSLPPLVPISTQDEVHLSKRYINGHDDRQLHAKDTTYPYGAVGKLYWSDGAWCSGALVGSRHVLTAKHCLSRNASGTFAPGFDNKPRLGHGAVVRVITTNAEWGTPCGWKDDWAILILDTRLGDQRGFFGVQLPDKKLVDKPMFGHMGYPGDLDDGNRPYRVTGSTVQSFREWDCDRNGPFYTDTDTAGGQSGGPLWQDKTDGSYIWGTLSVTFGRGEHAWAGWGSGDHLLHTLKALREESI